MIKYDLAIASLLNDLLELAYTNRV